MSEITQTPHFLKLPGLNPKEIQRLCRFLVVGASGTVLDLILLSLLIGSFGLSAVLANTLSFGVGVINNFVLNRFWTYPEARTKPLLAQFGQFAAINVVGLLLSDAILSVAEAALHAQFGANAYLPAKLIAVGLVFFWNYAANRLWTYNDVNQAAAA